MRHVELAQLLAEADYVVCQAVATEQTENPPDWRALPQEENDHESPTAGALAIAISTSVRTAGRWHPPPPSSRPMRLWQLTAKSNGPWV